MLARTIDLPTTIYVPNGTTTLSSNDSSDATVAVEGGNDDPGSGSTAVLSIAANANNLGTILLQPFNGNDNGGPGSVMNEAVGFALTNTGVIQANPGGGVAVTVSGNYNNRGSLVDAGANLTLNGGQWTNPNGGTVNAWGVLAVSSPLVNNGVLKIETNKGAALAINGAYTQSGDGALDIDGPQGDATPTGAVTFRSGSRVLGIVNLINGSATCPAVNNLPAGNDVITATYAGDANYSSVTNNDSQVVNKAHLAVLPDNASKAAGQANPAFTYTLGGFVLGENATTAGVAGAATLGSTATTGSPAGTYPITVTSANTLTAANYDFPAGSFGTGTLTVNSAGTTVVLSASTTSPVFNQAETFTVTVSPVSGGILPSGSVALMDGSATLATLPLTASGATAVATYSTSSLGLGSHAIKAVYGGDANNQGASSTLALVVGKDATTTALAAAPAAVLFGKPVVLTATLTVNTPGSGTPTGSVTFLNGSVTLGTATLAVVSGADVATLSLTSLPPGTDAVTASYGGDPNDATSYSATSVVVSNHPADDFLGNGVTSQAIFRRVSPALIDWFVKGVPAITGAAGRAFGAGALDVPLSGDFDGDGEADLAVYRPSTAEWYVQDSGSNYVGKPLVNFGGGSLDEPVPADYFGTGKTVPAVFRPSTGQWFLDNGGPGKNVTVPVTFPANSLPAPGDYDNVGKAEAAAYDPAKGQWLVDAPGATSARVVATFGGPQDTPVPGAYDALTVGNAKVEPALWRASTGQFFIHDVATNKNRTVQFAVGDIPAPGDYDGVGETEAAVYRPSTGQWLVEGPNDTSPHVLASPFGGPKDTPNLAPYPYRAVIGVGPVSASSLGTPIPVDLGSTARAFTPASTASTPLVPTASASAPKRSVPTVHEHMLLKRIVPRRERIERTVAMKAKHGG